MYKTKVPPASEHALDHTFSLIIASTKDKPRVLEEGNQGERPDNTTDSTNNIFSRWTRRVWKDSRKHIKWTRPDITFISGHTVDIP
jgi:hypothetical protein